MRRRHGIVLAGMGDVGCHEEQEDVFEDAVEADVPSAQGPDNIDAETPQVGHTIAFGSKASDTSAIVWGQCTLHRRMHIS